MTHFLLVTGPCIFMSIKKFIVMEYDKHEAEILILFKKNLFLCDLWHQLCKSVLLFKNCCVLNEDFVLLKSQ